MTIPVVAVVGYRKSGKTKFIEYMIKKLIENGIKVGVVKHIHHGDFQVDVEGKDTWRYMISGAVAVAGISDKRIYLNMLNSKFPSIKKVLNFMKNTVDIIFLEGFSHIVESEPNILKIVVGKNYPTDKMNGDVIIVNDEKDYAIAIEKIKSMVISKKS